MKGHQLAAVIEHGQGLLEGRSYNLLMLLVAIAGVLVAVVVPVHLARRSRRRRRPRFSLPVDSARTGETISVVASGFNKREVVDLFFTNHKASVRVPRQKRLGRIAAQANENGRITESIVVPANLPVGENLIVIERLDPDLEPTDVAATFYVLMRRDKVP